MRHFEELLRDRDLVELAGERLFEDRVVAAAQLGEAFIAEFLDVKGMEWTEYCREITEWERNRYLGYY